MPAVIETVVPSSTLKSESYATSLFSISFSNGANWDWDRVLMDESVELPETD